jgi:hypothetical protein
MNLRWLAVTAAAGALLAGAAAAPAHASVTYGHPQWIIQNDELYNLRAAGDTADGFQYRLCGDVYSNPRLKPCRTGQVHDFTDYYQLLFALQDGLRGTVLYDPEGWAYTPAEQFDNMPAWVCKAAKLASSYGVHLIAAPVWPSATIGQTWAAAAKCRAYAVDLQIQWATGYPFRYLDRVKYALSVIRPLNSTIKVIGGIGMDPGGTPVDPSVVYRTYLKARTRVSGFWLNLPLRLTGTGCAVTTGCTAQAIQFLAMTDQ